MKSALTNSNENKDKKNANLSVNWYMTSPVQAIHSHRHSQNQMIQCLYSAKLVPRSSHKHMTPVPMSGFTNSNISL